MSIRFTERAQRVILTAQEDARRWKHDSVEPLHLLSAIVGLEEGVAAFALGKLGVPLRELRAEIEKTLGQGGCELLIGEIPFRPESKRVLELSVEEALAMKHGYVGTEHLLLGVFGVDSSARFLAKKGIPLEDVRAKILEVLGDEKFARTPRAAEPAPTRQDFGRMLLTISTAPEVKGILLLPGPTGDAPTVIVLLKEGSSADAAFLSLSPHLPAMERLVFKEPGKIPVFWSNGEWKEDAELGSTLAF